MIERRPSLTATVLHGLGFLAGLVEAGSSADITGAEEQDMDSEQRKDWQAILDAVRWIREMQVYCIVRSTKGTQ